MKTGCILAAVVVVVICVEQLEGYQKDKLLKGINKVRRGISERGPLSSFTMNKRRTKRDLSNQINSIPNSDHQRTSSGFDEVGMELMDEFMFFLTLKETGILDFCMGRK